MGLVDRICGRWVASVDRRPGLTLAIVGACTVVVAAYGILNLGVDSDPRKLINRNLEFQQRQRELTRVFHSFSDGILVVIDADSPTAAGRAADQLAARLAPRTDLYSAIDVPGGGPFYAKNALLYLSVDQLEDLTDRLSKVQPFLAELSEDQSLVGVTGLLRKALVAEREGGATGFDLAEALDRVGIVVQAAADGRRAADPWGSALFGGAVGKEARQRVVALRPAADNGMLAAGGPELVAIRTAARELGLTEENAFRVRITGEPVMNYEELGAIAKQSRFVAVVSFFLFTATVIFALRSTRVVLALCGSLAISLLWSNGLAALTVGNLNTISAAFNVLIVGLGGEFGIHFAMRYIELVSKGRPRHEALVETAETVGESLLSSAGTTSIGFFIFLLTDFKGVAQLGLISGIGMFLSFTSTMVVLPALLAIGEEKTTIRPLSVPAWMSQLDRLPIRHAAKVRVGAAIVGVIAIALLPFIRFDYNLTKLHDKTLESVATFQELLANTEKSPWTADIIAPDLDAAVALAGRLTELPSVAEARTVLDFVPRDQESKLEIIQTASLFVPAALKVSPPRTNAERRSALARLGDEAQQASGAGGRAGEAAGRLAAAIRQFLAGAGREGGPHAAFDNLEHDLAGSLPSQIRDLQSLMQASQVTREDLPDELVRQMLAGDGRARVQATPSGDVSQSRELERFVKEVRKVAPDAGGLGVYTVEWGRVAWQAMLAALVGGVACMLIFLVVLWRSIWDSVLAFFPLILAALLTCATLVLFGGAFNFANVIVLPMLIGMSVDSGVHLVHRHRTNPDEEDVLATSTARAVFYAALTTILSFGSLAFTPHGGIAAIGEMLTVGVALVLVCYVVVLPAVLVWDDARRRKGAAG
jgi:hopanoid biosynthesis associated RND transporter like protein HpnN